MRTGRHSGYSLIELLVVVVILALVAAIALPSTSADQQQKLNLAAQEYAAALRFARNEATRTGVPHGFQLNDASTRMQLFSLDMNTIPPNPIYDVNHPVTKQSYDFELKDIPFSADPDVIRVAQFGGTCNDHRFVYFDAFGTPRCTDPKDVLLESYQVTLDENDSIRVIVIDGITGRVTIQ